MRQGYCAIGIPFAPTSVSEVFWILAEGQRVMGDTRPDRELSVNTARVVFERHSVLIPTGDKPWVTGPSASIEDGFALEDLQAAVGGFVELVKVCDLGVEALKRSMVTAKALDAEDGEWWDDLCGNLRLVVNEEGRMMSLPDNPEASALAGQDIVGSAVLLDQRRFK